MLILLASVGVHCFMLSGDQILLQTNDVIRMIILFIQGLVYLMYPFMGWLADVCFTRYKMITWSTMFILTGSMMGVVAALLLRIIPEYEFCAAIVMGVALLVGIPGMGMFESNVIQFGMDQLLEASSEHLSTFIHWYYWTTQLSPLINFYTVMVTVYMPQVVKKCAGPSFVSTVAMTSASLSFTLGLLITMMSVCFLQNYKKDLFIEKAGVRTNPITHIFKVLRYTWNHSCPEKRSAFTYWEEDVPPRIDVGKHKYGGPFTNEEVEDVKTFFRLLLLLAALIGFQLMDDGRFIVEPLADTICPSVTVIFLVIYDYHLRYLVAVVGVPFYHLVWLRRFRTSPPNMLARLRLGAILPLIQQLVNMSITTIYANMPDVHVCTHKYPCIDQVISHSNSSLPNCLLVQMNYTENSDLIDSNATCPVILNHPQPFYLWLILPQLLSSVSYFLVFMTALEFICAQAPRTTQGMLIGLWYAMFSLRYIVIVNLDGNFVELPGWYIYHGVKVGITFLLTLLFLFMARHYKYRQRVEIVPERPMVEDIYERLIKLGREYEEERDQFLLTSSYGSTAQTHAHLRPQTFGDEDWCMHNTPESVKSNKRR